jgi:hypothetical protein
LPIRWQLGRVVLQGHTRSGLIFSGLCVRPLINSLYISINTLPKTQLNSGHTELYCSAMSTPGCVRIALGNAIGTWTFLRACKALVRYGDTRRSHTEKITWMHLLDFVDSQRILSYEKSEIGKPSCCFDPSSCTAMIDRRDWEVLYGRDLSRFRATPDWVPSAKYRTVRCRRAARER